MTITDIRYEGRDYRVYRNKKGQINRVTVYTNEWPASPWEAIPLTSRVIEDLGKLTDQH